MKDQQEDQKKMQQAADLRGEAKAFTLVGAAGAAVGGLGALGHFGGNFIESASGVAEIAAIAAPPGLKPTKKDMAVFAIVSVALGALLYAAHKYNRAHEVELSRKKQSGEAYGDWVSRIAEAQTSELHKR